MQSQQGRGELKKPPETTERRATVARIKREGRAEGSGGGCRDREIKGSQITTGVAEGDFRSRFDNWSAALTLSIWLTLDRWDTPGPTDLPTDPLEGGTRARREPPVQCPSAVLHGRVGGLDRSGCFAARARSLVLPPLTSPVRPASLCPRDRPEARPRRPRSYLGRTPGRRLTSRWSGGRARSARRNYTGPPPPTAPTWPLVHTLLATDSSILTLSSAVVTPYYSLRPFLPSSFCLLLSAPVGPSRCYCGSSTAPCCPAAARQSSSTCYCYRSRGSGQCSQSQQHSRIQTPTRPE